MNLKKIISFLVVVGLLGLLSWNVFQNWEMVKSYSWNFKTQEVVLLFILVILIYPLNVYSWHLVTRFLGMNVSLVNNFKVWMYSNITRFLPGGFWQYLGRVYLLSKEGVNKTHATTALITESLFVLLSGSLAVIFAFLFLKSGFLSTELKIFFIILGSLSFLFLIFNKDIFKRLIFFIGKISGRQKLVSINIHPRNIPILIFVFSLQFLVNGGILFLLASGVATFSLDLLPVFIGVFAASWILGYITVFAPSGLGVQEASIAALLAFYFAQTNSADLPFPIATLLSIIFRFTVFIGEVVTFSCLFLFARRST